MRKIKVLHIITRFCKGGAQEVVLQIVRNLDREKYEVTLAFGPQDLEMEWDNIPEVKTVIIPQLVRKIDLIKDITALFRLYFFIRKEKFDIVHTHTSKAGILGRTAAKLSGAPIIFHMPHGSIFHPIYFRKFTIFILSKIEKIAAIFTDKIIVGSENEKEDYINNGIGHSEQYVKVPDYFIRDGFGDVKVDKQAKKRELNIPDGVFILGNIARLVPEKGHLFCLEAFRKVVEEIPDTLLLFVGDGPQKKTIERRIVELELQKNVILTGFLEDIPAIFSIIDISLHTSFWEGSPVAIAEAMYLGKAIIATNVSGIPEIIEDGINGILVGPQNVDELSKAIIRLLKDRELLGKLGKEAERYARLHFDSKSIVNKVNEFYDSLLKMKAIRDVS